MAGRPSSAPASADPNERALIHAREHLERLGHRVLDERRHGRRGGRLLVSRSTDRRELVFCELRIEPLAAWEDPAGELGRRQLRRAAVAWLAVNPAVDARTLRFDRLTVFVGRDGMPIGLEHVPQAF